MPSLTQVIVAIDIGSSSVRCSAYEYIKIEAEDDEDDNITPQVHALENCQTHRAVRSVQPNTGKIQLLGNTGHDSDEKNQKSLMENLDDCMDELLEKLRKKEDFAFEIVAVGFSAFVMNLVGVDSEGCIVGDEASISYACNSQRVAKQCRNLRMKLSEETKEEMYQKTGAPIHSAYALAQLLEMYNYEHHDELVRRVHKWQTIPSICLSRWTGETFFPISYSEASWTGLLNFRTCNYESTVVDLLPEPCRQALPNLMDFSDTTVLGVGIQMTRNQDGLHNPYWDRWPELRGKSAVDDDDTRTGCRLFLGLGDGACANIGSKCSTASRIAVTIGTSAAARVCLPFSISTLLKAPNDNNPRPLRVPKGLFCYRINRSHVLVGGALTDGGSVVEWISDLLNLNSSPGAFDECMAKVQALVEKDYQSQAAEAGGTATQQSSKQPLTVVPFLSGERSTGYRDGATGAMLGLTRETTSAHLLKSSLEGVTLRLNAILTLIRNAMVNDDKEGNNEQPCIIASGKALEVNSLWRNLIADCSGMEVIMDGDTEEGTSRGAALAVAVALSSNDSDALSFEDEPLSPMHQSIPSVSAKAYWAEATESQDNFLEAISPLFEPR